MNIAFLIDKFEVGGTQRQLILLANRLAAMKLGKVMMICLQREGALARELSSEIELVNLGLGRVYGAAAMRQMTRLRSRLHAWKCDVLHSFLPSANIFCAVLGRVAHIPTVVSRRDVGIYHSKVWRVVEEKFAYRLATSVICVSNEVRDILLQREPHLRPRTTVVPNAIDIEAADRFAQSVAVEVPAGDYMVAVGNIKPVKAYDFLMEALPGLKGKVVVIGTGEHRNKGKDLERMRNQAEAVGLQDKILFVGHKDPPQIAAIVKRAAFAIHPSYSEGMSNAILEYMVHGNAVVCRDILANRELVDDGVTGYLFKGIPDFTEQVNHLVEEPERRAEMGLSARKFVVEHHGLDRIMSTYVEHYRALMSGHPVP